MDPEPALPDSCLSMFSEELMSKAWDPDSTLDLLLLAEAQGLPFPSSVGWAGLLPSLFLTSTDGLVKRLEELERTAELYKGR